MAITPDFIEGFVVALILVGIVFAAYEFGVDGRYPNCCGTLDTTDKIMTAHWHKKEADDGE